MTLPEVTAKNIFEALVSDSLLEEAAATELVEALNEQKNVNWNLVLTKQFETEDSASDETHS